MPKPTRIVYSILLYTCHGRSTLRYCEAKDEVAKFNRAADKTPLQRLSYMSCRPSVTLGASGCLTVQNYKDYLNWQKNNTKHMNYRRRHLAAQRSIHCSNCGNTGNSWSISERT